MRVLSIPTTFGLNKPVNGGQNRFCNITTQLVRHCNKVTVLEEAQFSDLNNTTAVKIETYRDIRIGKRTLTVFRDLNPSFICSLWRLFRYNDYDIVQITHPSGVFALRAIIRILGKKSLIVYDAYDVAHEFVRETFARSSDYSTIEKLVVSTYTRILEGIACRLLTDMITCVSRRDMNLFLKEYNVDRNSISLIPSGCRISNDIADTLTKENCRQELGLPQNKVVVVFHGSCSHQPNKEAFEFVEHNISPEFARTNEDVLFVIGGTGCSTHSRGNLKSVGFIQDLDKFLRSADIAVVPITCGSGTRMKILDYMAYGLAIVSTRKGIEGIEAMNGIHALIVDSADGDLLVQLRRIVNDASLRRSLGSNARTLAEDRYDWNMIGNTLTALYERAILGHH